jgi:hypothetical protein
MVECLCLGCQLTFVYKPAFERILYLINFKIKYFLKFILMTYFKKSTKILLVLIELLII